MVNKEPHVYTALVKHLNKERNRIIADYRKFKRSSLNRKYMPHAAFDATRAVFRAKIAEMDNLLKLARLSIHASKVTGVTHFFDFDTKALYAPEAGEQLIYLLTKNKC